MRTKLLAAGLGLVVAVTLGVALTPVPVPADDTPGPAVVIMDFGCGVLDGNGNGFSATASQAVITGNARNNGKLTCKVKGVPNPTGRAVIFNFANTGFLCGTLSDVTADWQNVVSASGNVTLQCRNDG